MDIEQKAIKAVANVAAQAYRRAFDVKPDMTTGALAVMADAIAALDQPTLAPKVDKEDVIWRAIGSLTQRVRDLEQPTPAPEPPTVGRRVSREEALHIAKDVMDKAEQERQAQPAPTIQPEASQPLPAAVESELNVFQQTMQDEMDADGFFGDKAFQKAVLILRHSLAALWPKAGQVDEVTEAKLVEKWMQKNGWEWPVAGADCSDYDEAVRTVKWFMSHIQAGQVPSMEAISDELCGAYVQPAPSSIAGASKLTREDATRIATSLRHWLSDQLSRMGQPAKPDKFDCDNCDVTDLRPVQPSPVTPEKLAEFIGNWLEPRMQTVWGYSDMAHAILQAFPALGQGRLTRDDPRVKAAVEKFLKEANYSPGPLFRTLITDLLALQPQAKVGKEQWERLDRFPMDEPEMRAVKAWLKAEFGMEVAG